MKILQNSEIPIYKQIAMQLKEEILSGKLAAGESLLHEPRILFLDEPTIGLDAVSKLAVREFIKKMNREHKTTVILTTHDMQDIEAIAERVILIGKGQILLDGSLQDLRTAAGVTEEVPGEARNVEGRRDDAVGGQVSVDTAEKVPDDETDTSAAENTATKSGLNLDHVMAALYKKLDIM